MGLDLAKDFVAAMNSSQRSLLEKLRASRKKNNWLNTEPHKAHAIRIRPADRQAVRERPQKKGRGAAGNCNPTGLPEQNTTRARAAPARGRTRGPKHAFDPAEHNNDVEMEEEEPLLPPPRRRGRRLVDGPVSEPSLTVRASANSFLSQATARPPGNNSRRRPARAASLSLSLIHI